MTNVAIYIATHYMIYIHYIHNNHEIYITYFDTSYLHISMYIYFGKYRASKHGLGLVPTMFVSTWLLGCD